MQKKKKKLWEDSRRQKPGQVNGIRREYDPGHCYEIPKWPPTPVVNAGVAPLAADHLFWL